MEHNILENLFGSVPRARILRLFIRNPEERFHFEALVSRSQIRPKPARLELRKLIRFGLVLAGMERIQGRKKSKGKASWRKIPIYQANKEFVAFRELQDLVGRASVAPRNKLLRQLNAVGRIKLAVLSGIFINNGDHSRIDLLIVGDNLNRRKFSAFLSHTESELGKSIQHTIMDTEEFQYRMDMYDRFLRDILEYPHEKLINKLNL
ncbi:MAG: hypothetical protein A3J10_00970 [Candidatus Sungbacteria bacterium RIFCSPLOWO2_02_FULL_54_10]|nr:MAG: hypothetical protein A3J10_00970 [Candidatus Sungbacteria bacterium RIFCSPLOWO2_02_FULL_54_10]